MGLNWLSTIWKDLKQPTQTVSIPGSLTEARNRILFIGFGKIPDFFSFNWDEWKWLNAAGFEVDFTN